MYVREYIKQLSKNWIALMCGVGGLFFTVLATFFITDLVWLKNTFFLVAFASVCVGAYQVWANEYKKNTDLKAQIEKLDAEKNLQQVDVVFDNGEPYVKAFINPNSRKYLIQVEIVNTGNKSNAFKPFCKVESKPNPLPLLFDTEALETTHLFNPKDRRLVRVAEWIGGEGEITLCVPPSYDKEKYLAAKESHKIEILVSGNDIEQFSKPFLVYIKDGWLMCEPVEKEVVC